MTDSNTALFEANQRLVETLGRLANTKIKRTSGDIYFPFIANQCVDTLLKFFSWIERETDIKGVRNPHFLDVGCGIGNILSLANSFAFRICGVELREEYKDYSIVNPSVIWYGDALKYPYYNDSNIIYFYQPIQDRKLQMDLERKIIKGMKKDAYICTPYLMLLREFQEAFVVKNLKTIHPPGCNSLFIAQKK